MNTDPGVLNPELKSENFKIAVVFPGQGSQCIGMGKTFYDRYDAARTVFKEAGDTLGINMEKLCFEGPETELNLTHNTQPAILTASIAILRSVEKETPLKPAFLAGHSLGEYTALVASGAMEFRDAVRIVAMRGKFMQEAALPGVGAMAAIIGLKRPVIEKICRSCCFKEIVVAAANFNSPEQTVISGHKEALDRAIILAKENGAKRVIPLPVSVPSHSPLMKPAAQRLAEELERIEIKPLRIPVITNVEAAPVESESRVAELLVKQLFSPVRWVETVMRMNNEGVTTIVEIGPGRVLSGLARRIDHDVKTFSIENVEDMKQIEALNAGGVPNAE